MMSTLQLNNVRMIITGQEVMNVKLMMFCVAILLYCLVKMILFVEDMVGLLLVAPLRSVDGWIHQFF